jgi:glycosyltransferase involved in cell wall biosynthesis
MNTALQRIEPAFGARRLRLVWVEEWMSMLAGKVLPELAERHHVYYVTAGDEIPQANFVRVIRCKRWRYMNIAGFELSHAVNKLYRDGLIDVALVWASIGFGLGRVPFINLEGTSVYAEIELFASRTPFYKRPKYLTGLAHYALPEMVCNRRAARTIVPTQALGDDIRRLHHLDKERIVVLPHGVEPGHLALYREKPPLPRAKLLFVGRLHFRKGLLPVLREFVRRADIDAEFLIAGDGPDRAEMEQVAQGDARIKILGNVDRARLASLLRETNVFVFPTYYEGFGLALTEAMASGHACVSYDIPVVREVLGGSGVLVPLGDAVALVDAVGNLVKEPRSITDHAARAHARAAQFSWDEVPASVERIVREVMDERGSGPAATMLHEEIR